MTHQLVYWQPNPFDQRNQTNKKEISVGETLAKFRLFPSVSGTDTTLTKGIKPRKRDQWGKPLHNSGYAIQLVELIPI